MTHRLARLDIAALLPRAVAVIALLLAAFPDLALASSPFVRGSGAVQVEMLAILTPIAVIAVMGSGTLAWFGRISWMWFIGAVVGTVLVFGGPQIVAWVRSAFGV